MRQIEKYLFNVTFDEDDLARVEAAAKAAEAAEPEEDFEEIEIPSFSEEEIAAARAEGFDAGKAEGISETNASIEARISETLAQIAGQIGTLFQEQTAANTAMFDDAVNIAVAISRKCFPHLSETHALQIIDEMVREVLAEILEEPRALVHVHPDLVEPLNARISDIADASNFEGQVLVIDDQNMPVGDCRISWSSGSAERDMKVLWQRVDEIVEQNVHALTQPEPHGDSESPAPKRAAEPAPGQSGSGAAPASRGAKPAAANPAPGAAPADAAPPRATEQPAPEHQNKNDFNTLRPDGGDGMNAGRGAGRPATPPPAAAEMDSTGAHLQAGPGNVDAPEDSDILELDQSETPGTDQDMDETAESMPPSGGNR